MFGNAAGPVVPELAFNEFRNRPVPFLLSGQEGFKLLGDYLIQKCVFRIAGAVAVDSHEGVA